MYQFEDSAVGASIICTESLGLQIGRRLRKNAYDKDGNIVFEAGNIITTRSQLMRLSEPDIQFMDSPPKKPKTKHCQIKNPKVEAKIKVEEKTAEPENEMSHALKIKEALVQDVGKVFFQFRNTGEVDFGIIEKDAAKIKEELMKNPYAVSSTVFEKCPKAYTITHSVNVGILSMYLAMRSDYAAQATDIGIGGLLHDIGKEDISTFILRKNGPLDCSEMNTMKAHPLRGAQILFSAGYKNGIAISCVLDHHERLNGKGYPCQKAGAAILPYSRITSICDVFDALTTDRPYRKAMEEQYAISIMTQKMSTGLDLSLLKLFIPAINDLLDFRRSDQNRQIADLSFNPMQISISNTATLNRLADLNSFA